MGKAEQSFPRFLDMHNTSANRTNYSYEMNQPSYLALSSASDGTNFDIRSWRGDGVNAVAQVNRLLVCVPVPLRWSFGCYTAHLLPHNECSSDIRNNSSHTTNA